jgi:spore coat protein U-like protein
MKRLLVFFALLLMFVAPVRAQVCTASISSMNFGPISPATDSSASAMGSITVSCSGWVLTSTVRSCINIGTGSGGTGYAPRTALNGTNTLQYNLFADSAGSTVWGTRRSTSYGPVTIDVPMTASVTPQSASRTVPIYGRVSSGQTALVAGTYSSAFSGVTQAELTYQGSLLGLVACSSITAGSTALSFNVNASVINDCTLAATNINFGATGVLTSTLTATGTLSVACTNNDPYSIALSAGSGSGASVADRSMTRSGGSDQIHYQLYTNAGYSTPWGDGTGSTVPVTGTGTGSSQAITVYARVLPQTTPAAGTYSDLIVATITY